jgi:hypothetical protein
MNDITNIQFDITYAEETVTVTAKIASSPNQYKAHRMLTLEETLKRQNIPFDAGDGEIRVHVQDEGGVEKVVECFRLFEKHDKIKETKFFVHKQMASELQSKLKTIFPPPEAQISVKHIPPATAA